jgi:hypothetical protein
MFPLNSLLVAILPKLKAVLLSPITLCVIIVLLALHDCTGHKPSVDTLQEMQALRVQLKNDSSAIKYYVALDKTHVTEMQGLVNQNIGLLEEIYQKDSINAKYHTKIENLQALLRTRQIDTVYLKQDTAFIDRPYPVYNKDSSAFTLQGRFTDPWYSVTAKVSSDPKKLAGSLYLIATDSVTYFFDRRKKGTWPFRKEMPFVTIKHANPYINEIGVQYVEVPDVYRPKKWSIGIQGGVMLLPTPGTIYIGLGIQRSLIRF